MFNPNVIAGYNKLLPGNKKLFDSFLQNFYKNWDSPEEHKPTKVKFAKDSSNGPYLKVDCADGNWLHVKSPYTWY